MMTLRVSLVLAVALIDVGRARAEITIGKWTPIFKGIEFAAGETDAAEPRLQQVRAVRVDLREPDVDLLSTPENGEAPLETTSETTSEFLLRHKVQVAINANFFAPCCMPGDKDLIGLAISRGQRVSPPASAGAAGTKVLAITREKIATIDSTEEGFPSERYWTAVAGSDWVIVHGAKAVLPPTPFRTLPHPRTAVGISRDGRYLLLITIDGRQPGWSDGATLEETADWLLRFGAHEGLNLDGGGSTTLVREEEGRAVVLNRPSGVALGSAENADKVGAERVQRSNGNNFGVFAKPLPRTTSTSR